MAQCLGVVRKFQQVLAISKNLRQLRVCRNVATKPSGAILPEPDKVPFGMAGIFAAVVPGLLIGSAISRYIASFLEENDLFVPADDDDDDD